jgi:DNA-binding MurR/RpiR family transcriptional regulator
MSRPARKSDAAFASRIATYMTDGGLSARQLAKNVDVSASTLTRSLKLQEFSKDLREKLGRELDGEADDPVNLLHKVLHILREVDKIKEEVEMAVRKAMKRLEAAR